MQKNMLFVSILIILLFGQGVKVDTKVEGNRLSVNEVKENDIEDTDKEDKGKEEANTKTKTEDLSSFEEYILGVVAAEMPASFEMEALKAQALVARTYAIARLNDGVELCINPSHCQAYVDPDMIPEESKDKLKQAVEQTKGKIITYEEEPILAVFHSTSGGKTEKSADLWGGNLPYLISVESPNEESAPKFSSTVTVTKQQLKQIFGESVKSIKIINYNSSGRVEEVKVNDKLYKGAEIRQLLGLNSTNFTIQTKKESITFEVIGYGHGVGMSQYGANAMAKEGSDYEEIIKHYYNGVKIVKDQSRR